jgi:hypothetical protein
MTNIQMMSIIKLTLHQTHAKSEKHAVSLTVLGRGYLSPLILISVNCTITDSVRWGVLAFGLTLVFVLMASWKISGMNYGEWYN